MRPGIEARLQTNGDLLGEYPGQVGQAGNAGMGHPLIVSYYTPGTAYEEHAKQLKTSVDRLGLDSRIEPRQAKASWVENCAQKALFIQEMRKSETRPILWLDADAILRRPLKELMNCEADFAAVRQDGWCTLGGQVYFGTGANAEAMIERWCQYCRDYPYIWDQVSLGYAWWDMSLESDLKTLWLDESIILILKRKKFKRPFQLAFSRAAITHKQESRRSKMTQSAILPEFRNDMLPEWWKDAARRNAPFPIGQERLGELGLQGYPAITAA